MAQIWVPLSVLLEGKLPPVCLVTGDTAGVSVHDLPLPWAGGTAPGRGHELQGAMLQSAMSSTAAIPAKLPMTEAGAHRYRVSRGNARNLGCGMVVCLMAAMLIAQELHSGAAFLTIAAGGLTALIGWVVYFGRGTSLGLLRRVGDEVLLDVPNERASEVLKAQFPKSG